MPGTFADLFSLRFFVVKRLPAGVLRLLLFGLRVALSGQCHETEMEAIHSDTPETTKAI